MRQTTECFGRPAMPVTGGPAPSPRLGWRSPAPAWGRPVLAALLLVVLLGSPPARPRPAHADTLPCSIQWTGATDNSWMEPANWSLLRVPGTSDDVCIRHAGPIPLEFTGFSRAQVRNLTISSPSSSFGLLQIHNNTGAPVTFAVSGSVTLMPAGVSSPVMPRALSFAVVLRCLWAIPC